MTAFDKIVLKSKLFNRLQDLGYNVTTTDTPNIVFFTDKPVNNKSKKQDNFYITSFGIKGAEKFLEQNPTHLVIRRFKNESRIFITILIGKLSCHLTKRLNKDTCWKYDISLNERNTDNILGDGFGNTMKETLDRLKESIVEIDNIKKRGKYIFTDFRDNKDKIRTYKQLKENDIW